MENTGGLDTNYDYSIKIIDFNDAVVNNASGTDTINWGENKNIVLALSNSQMSNGQYQVVGIFTDKKTNRKSILQQYMAVTGISASLSVQTNKKNYLKGESANISTTVTP